MAVRATKLVGRGDELRAIEAAVENRKGLFFAGPAGVGKTRLLKEAKGVLERHGFDVIEIIGAQATAEIPLAPLLGLVDLDQQGDLSRLVLSALTRRSRRSAVAMLVDDVQRLDEASASLVHRIAASEIAMVFATYRSTDPLSAAGESLWKDEHLDRVSVKPMSRLHQQELASLMIGQVDAPSESWLWEVAAGHPLFLRELLVDADSNGRIRETSEGCSVARLDGVPPRLFELVGRNVTALDQHARRALEFVAIGGSVPSSVLVDIVGERALQRLLDDGLCVLRNQTLFLAHPLFGETAAAGLTRGEVEELQRVLANGLDGVEGSEVQSSLLRIAAGEPVGEDRLRRAFEIARKSRQPEIAQTIGTVLVDKTADPLVCAQLGFAYAMTGEWETADRLFEDAASKAGPEQVEELYLIWLQASFEYRKQPDEALALAKYVVENTSGPANQVARALQYRVRMFFEPLLRVLEEREDMFAEDLDPRAASIVWTDQTTTAWGMLRIRHALNVPVVEQLPDVEPVQLSRWRHMRWAAEAWRDGVSRVEKAVDQLRPSVAETGDADAETSLAIAVALANSAGLNCGAVLAARNEISALDARVTDRRTQQLMKGVWAKAVSRSKAFSEPAEYFVSCAESAEPATYALSGTLLYVAASRAERRDGGDPEPFRKEALDLARWRNDGVSEVFAMRDEYAFGDEPTPRTVARLQTMADLAGPGLAQLYASEARAHLERDGAKLAELSVRAEQLGALGLAWDMAAAAQLFLVESDHGAAGLRAERRSHWLASLDPLARSPLHELMTPILSQREVEVAELVSKGLSNPAVAEQLYLSTRTVGRHLERIYRKLGISARDELASLIR